MSAREGLCTHNDVRVGYAYVYRAGELGLLLSLAPPRTLQLTRTVNKGRSVRGLAMLIDLSRGHTISNSTL